MTHLRRASLGCLVAVLLLSGCSGKEAKPPRFKVSGHLTRGGKPLETKPMVGMIQVIFYPVPSGTRPANPNKAGIQRTYGKVEANGDFTVHDGLAADKYVIAVRQFDAGPQGADTLKDKFSFKNSKIIEEISEDRVLDIELDKYK